MSKIMAMEGVQFIGIIQKLNVLDVLSTISFVLFLIGTGVFGLYKAHKNDDAFYFFCVAIPAFILSLIILGGPLPRVLQKGNYIQVRVLHNSEAAFRILEEYEDVSIDGSVFTIKLDSPRKDE